MTAKWIVGIILGFYRSFSGYFRPFSVEDMVNDGFEYKISGIYYIFDRYMKPYRSKGQGHRGHIGSIDLCRYFRCPKSPTKLGISDFFDSVGDLLSGLS